MSYSQPLRVLVAKVGLDGHDRGAVLVARALRDAGMEVIYTGRHQRPEQIVQAAVDEDVDVIGISSLADGHRSACAKIGRKLKELDMNDVLFIVGGFIPEEDFPDLKASGVAEVFPSGALLTDIVDYVKTHARPWLSEERSSV